MSMFTLGAFALIFDQQKRVLLSHRRDMDIWNLPGGAVETGELPTEAVVRETREEAGLDVVVERLVGVYGKPGQSTLVFAFQCRVIAGKLIPTDEADAHGYFAPEEIPPNTPPRQIERVHDALAAAKEPVFRRQMGPSTSELLQQL